MGVFYFYFWFEGVDEDTQDCAINDCSRIDWTPSMDRYLIDFMLEEVRSGNKIDYVLNNQAWSDMVVLFKERFGIQFDKDHLKQCCKCLEKLYYDMRSLLEQKGFLWDETRQNITAYDSVTVWDAYVMVCYTFFCLTFKLQFLVADHGIYRNILMQILTEIIGSQIIMIYA